MLTFFGFEILPFHKFTHKKDIYNAAHLLHLNKSASLRYEILSLFRL